MSYIGNQPTTVAFLTDTFSGNGLTTAFTMQVAPATTSSVLVAITGVVQDPSTYSVVGTTLTFSAAPPTGTANISVRYLGIPASGVTTTAYRTVTNFTATAGQTTFSVPSYTVGYIDVYRNGVRLAAADYTATNGTTVVLTNAASLNDSVVTESFYVSSVLNAIPATAGAVNSTYIANGAVGTAQLANANVTQAKLGTNVAGNGPAFSAYGTTTQTIATATLTKVTLSNEQFDTNNNFDSTTNYRFTPTVAGYYQITGSVAFNLANAYNQAVLYKNGSIYAIGPNSPSASLAICGVSSLIYLNGSTDYVELYCGQYSGSNQTTNENFTQTFLTGALVRAA
jgi:hypothetical protein